MMSNIPKPRVCAKCGKPGGTIPFWHDGKTDYYHLSCFRKIRK